MDEVPIAGRDDGGLFQRFVASYDAPAYVRRGRQVQEAYDILLERCRAQRAEWLKPVRMRLREVLALAGLSHKALDEMSAHHLRRLGNLLEISAPPAEPASSARTIQRALRDLQESLARFNQRWERFLAELDLTHVNQLREGYNRYYLVEKECALRSPRLARQGYHPLKPLTVAEIAGLLPLLPVRETER